MILWGAHEVKGRDERERESERARESERERERVSYDSGSKER